ncbi:MAG: FAD-dependent oxidoreductase [Aeromicrobium sp.]|uniref:FAD-dependent oxidoreductase n=1 Tax=Aeromicrobium sp. TaxID=1871063 RepID=UPI0039E3CB05
MPHVVTQSCCSDASCTVACPVNCIHPGPTTDEFGAAEMVYIDPLACVDCGACVTACPVDAIKPHTALLPGELPFLEVNARHFAESPHADRPVLAAVPHRRATPHGLRLRVAVVGSGPAGLYTADELLRRPGVTVDVFEKLDRPHGLARYGVAPDHQRTRQIADLFAVIERQKGFRYRLGVEVGKDVSLAALERDYDAVVHAVGASTDRRLDIAGEDLPGSVSATSVVGWYNGHPDHVGLPVDLSHERVVVVGNGNVALDVARILTADPETLASTSLDRAALTALRDSQVREVVVLGRRGPLDAAFTLPELLGLAALEDVDVLVDAAGLDIDESTQKGRVLAELAAREPREGRRRIVLRFGAAPRAILGAERVEAVEVERRVPTADGWSATGEVERIACGMVLRSIGYRGLPIDGLPFDEATGTVPHERGRVRPGHYVVGWIKRGPTGFLGTNKSCAQETVETLIGDLIAASTPARTREPLPA